METRIVTVLRTGGPVNRTAVLNSALSDGGGPIMLPVIACKAGDKFQMGEESAKELVCRVRGVEIEDLRLPEAPTKAKRAKRAKEDD